MKKILTLGVLLSVFSVAQASQPASKSKGVITLGSTKIATAFLNNGNGSCAVISSDTWISQNTDHGAGDCEWDIASGFFANAPICTVTTGDSGSQVVTASFKSFPSATSVRIYTTHNGSATDMPVQLICVGD